MNGKFSVIDHTADTALAVEGDTYEELFTAALEGWRYISAGSIKIGEDTVFVFEDMQNSVEELLVNFLDEVNYRLLSKKMLVSGIKKISIKQKHKQWQLSTEVCGAYYENGKIELNAEIKAVTFHQMSIKRKKGKLSTLIVFDI